MAEERRLQDKVLSDLRSYGKHMVAFKLIKCSDDGVPDIFFSSVPTGPNFVELKAEGKKLRPLQTFILNKLNICGTPSHHCDTWEEWVELKKKIGLVPSNFPQ